MDICSKGLDRKRRRMVAEEARAGMETSFRAYGHPFKNVVAFKYLVRTPTATDEYWMMVVANLRKSRKKWAWLYRTLMWEGGNARTSGNLFKAVIQAVLLSGLETWVVTPRLGGFHYRMDLCLMGKQPMRRPYGGWDYPPLGGTMREDELEEVETYINRR